MARSTSVWFLKKCNSQNRRKDIFFVAAVTVSSSYFSGVLLSPSTSALGCLRCMKSSYINMRENHSTSW